jgi:hypothetical protein
VFTFFCKPFDIVSVVQETVSPVARLTTLFTLEEYPSSNAFPYELRRVFTSEVTVAIPTSVDRSRLLKSNFTSVFPASSLRAVIIVSICSC